MPDLDGADTATELSAAYGALERRREALIAQRDRILGELNRLDAALDALRALVDVRPEPATVNGQPAAPTAPEANQLSTVGTEDVPEPTPTQAKNVDRKVRVIELLLENPQQWFTIAEIANITEGGEVTATRRNAVSETLRRLMRQSGVERDQTSGPMSYRAIPTALREILLARQ